MRHCESISIYSALIFLLVIVGCGLNPVSAPPALSFAVVNVGQGLCQIAAIRRSAIVWDVGQGSVREMTQTLEQLGSPTITALVISHGDLDHSGGLRYLPPEIQFSGIIVVSPYEDTSLLRSRAGEWGSRISFRVITQDDTLGGLAGAQVKCLWPPADLPLEKLSPNRRSLCFRLSSGEADVLLTSDIDTVAMRALSSRYGFAVASQVLVVPHHGSKGSVDPVFLGYVRPEVAIVSCASPNQYGHPSEEMVTLLVQMGATLLRTYTEGTIIATSNFEYWIFDVKP